MTGRIKAETMSTFPSVKTQVQIFYIVLLPSMISGPLNGSERPIENNGKSKRLNQFQYASTFQVLGASVAGKDPTGSWLTRAETLGAEYHFHSFV